MNNAIDVKNKMKLLLNDNDEVTEGDSDKNGKWTMVYDEGF